MDEHLYKRLKLIEKHLVEEIEKKSGLENKYSLKDSVEELSLYDNHPADLGSENFERAKDLSLHENRLLELNKVQKALQKVEKGNYGYCEICGQALNSARLEALPYADTCVECAAKEEVDSDSRPAEETILMPPFERYLKEHKDYFGYDGEDAWHEVHRFNKLRNVYYEDADPGEENRETVEDVENIEKITDKKGTEEGTYLNNGWEEEKN